jgi:hypothetical protein
LQPKEFNKRTVDLNTMAEAHQPRWFCIQALNTLHGEAMKREGTNADKVYDEWEANKFKSLKMLVAD